MSSNIEPNGDFVQKWIDVRKQESNLDQHILDLLQRYRKTDGSLNESAFLKSLLTYAKELEI